MSESPDKDPILSARNRDNQLRELDQAIQSLRADMYSLVSDINILLDEAGDGALVQAGKRGTVMAVRARVHRGAPTTVAFGLYDWQLHKFSTLSKITDFNTAAADWMVNLPDEQLEKMVELDRRRRVLNHRSSIARAERKSLLRFAQDERGIREALKSKNPTKQTEE